MIWEVTFDVYPNTFKNQNNTAKRVPLAASKEMGFLLAYCDGDDTHDRQHFIESYAIPAVKVIKTKALSTPMFLTLITNLRDTNTSRSFD